MEGLKEVERKSRRSRPPRGAARRTIRPHAHSLPFEVRRKAVQLCLEESFPLHLARVRTHLLPRHQTGLRELLSKLGLDPCSLFCR